jgi:hemerythrin
MAIEWTPDLAVGVEEIDTQHQKLFEAVNKLLAAMWDGKGKEETGNLLNFLAEYVVTHFGMEEGLMKALNYPYFPEHKKLHEQFVEEFSAVKRKYETGEITSSSCITVLDGTCDWLRNHISKVDKALGSYIQKSES